MVSLLLLASRRSSTIAYIRGRTTSSALAGYAEIFWSFGPLRREPPMSQDGDADDEGATAATGDEGAGRRKRPGAQSGSLTIVHPVTQPAQTQPDDFVPPLLERGASKLDDICPGLMEHLRPVSSFCSENKLVLITVLRTFVTNARPRARSATDLLIGMVGKEVGLASHRAARVAGTIREMDTLAEMTAEICSLFSSPVEAAAASEEATAFDVSDHTLNRALAWAWAVCGEVTEVTANRSQLTRMLPRIALFTDAFSEILTSNPTVRRSAPAASTGSRAASSQRNSEGATAAAAAPSRGHVPPSNVADLLLGFEVVDGGDDAADGAGPDERGRGRLDDDDDDDDRGSATGETRPRCRRASSASEPRP